LNAIPDLISDTTSWAFSLAADASTHQGTLLLDQPICIRSKGVLVNLYLIVIPFFDCHTAVNYVQMLVRVLTALLPGWRDKLISVATDSKATMTGRHGGIQTLTEREITH